MDNCIENLYEIINALEELADEFESEGLSKRARHLNDATDYLRNAIDEIEQVGTTRAIDIAALPDIVGASLSELLASMND